MGPVIMAFPSHTHSFIYLIYVHCTYISIQFASIILSSFAKIIHIKNSFDENIYI